MAEFALGLTKTAVEGTVSRVKSAIDEEEKLKERVRNDLVFITGEFQMMQSFLSVANKDHVRNEVVRTWVRQIRELAFDVEDSVELVVSLDMKSGWSWLWRVLPSCMTPPRSLDQAVTEIQRLKARVDEVSHRNTRYSLIGDSSSSSKTTAVTTVNSPALEFELLGTAHAGASSSAFHVLREVWGAMGKMRSDMEDLKQLITSEGSDHEVISLWESPGLAVDLGTISIVRKVYNDPEICKGFKSLAWVKLMHPFNLEEFLKSLLTQLYATSSRHQENLEPCFRTTEEYHHIKAKLMQQVSQQSYLVIVEELSTVVEWNTIKMYLPDNKNGSRIVVTTQQLGLALSCTGDRYQVSELRKFSDGQSLCAFFNKKKGCLDQNKSRGSCSRMVEARHWCNKFELIGHQGERDTLCNQLIWDGCVTSIWGVAGVGKSALVRSVYYYDMINDQFEPYFKKKKYSWVDVPRPFNLKDFSRRLLIDFQSVDLEAKETTAIDMMEGHDPIQLSCEFLRQNKCFVVIDGLCSTGDWDLIKAAFLAEPIKGHIFVITNEESIATHCAEGKGDVINVNGLNANEALNLFKKIAWGSEQLTADEEELSSLTMTKCGGLPKVVVAIGEYCHASYRSEGYIDPYSCYRSKKQWLEIINANFMGMLETGPISHSLSGLFSWMKSYFDNCLDSLKPCIFYLPVFPLGHNIRRGRLLRRWIAEGYSRGTPSSATEENGEKFFSELVKLSIIQQQLSPNKADTYQVNGFFREYIISRPMQDNLVLGLEGRCILNSQCVGQHLTISSSWDRDKIIFESMEFSRLRSMTVFGEWKSFFISANVNMRLLRVLDLEDTFGVTNGDIEQIIKLRPRLKFLSLRGCKSITCLPSSLGGLRQLQTLDIRGTSIVTLPVAIMKLEKLQYVRAGTSRCALTSTEEINGKVSGIATPPGMDDDGTSTNQPPTTTSATTTTTPLVGDDGSSTSQPPPASTTDDEGQTFTWWRSMTRGGLVFSWLSKLRRHGLLSSAHDGVQFDVAATIAGGLGKLTALHTLGVINVGGTRGKAVLRELKMLTQLRKLRLSGINRRNWQDFCCTISGHDYLESLSVELDDERQSNICHLGDISKPPNTLKSLKLYGGNVHVPPVWMKQLDSLKKVHLEDLELTISTQEDINSLVELRCQNMFRHLCVKPIQDGELHYGWWQNWLLGGRRAGYESATVLKINCSSYKLAIVFGNWLPEYVEVLVVHCSTARASLRVSGLENVFCLKEVWLKGSYSEAVKQHLQQKLEEHEKKPVLKMEDRREPRPF